MGLQKDSAQPMEQAPIPGLILRMSLPTVAAMTVTAVYNLADSFFAARLGTAAAAAVGIVFSFTAVVQAVGFTVALGGSTWISRLLGEKKQTEAQQVGISSLWFALILGGVMAAVGWFWAEPLVSLLGAPASVAPYAIAYLKPMALTAPLLGGSYVFSCVLRAYGRAKEAMVGVVAGGFVNIALNPLFAFGFSMKIAGLGYATLAGQGVAFVLLALPFCNRNSPCFLKKGSLCKQVRTYGIIIKNGLSSFVRQGLMGAVTVVLNRMAVQYGPSAVAAMTAAGKVSGLLYSAFLGIGQGYQPVAGYCYGAGNLSRMKKAFFFTLWFSVIAVTALSAGCYLLAPYCIVWFAGGDAQIIAIGTGALRWQLVAMPLVPLGVLANMTVLSADRPIAATLLACLRQGICLLVFLLVLPRYFGLVGLQLAQPAADGLTFCIALWVMGHFWTKKTGAHFERPLRD